MGTPPEDIVICEHPSADFDKANCRGEGQPLQVLDRQMHNKPIPPRTELGEGKPQGACWQHALARFHLARDTKQAVLEIIFVPRYGRGFVYSVVTKNGQDTIVQSPVWVS